MGGPLALARRLAAMSPVEIRTRATIAIRQRLDAWEVRRGRNPLKSRYSEPTAAHPRFFFEKGEAAIVAAEVKHRVPAECESVIESARQIQARRFDLLGYRGLSYGRHEIEWQLDPVHRIVAPRQPWYLVPYLDFNLVGDHKIIWELSRHQHLMLLARAWLYTRDEQFLNTLRVMWEGWHTANPYPMGINWASTLEVAFRSLSWIWVDQLTADAVAVPEAFRKKLREGIGECAIYTERYISTYFAPNTHLLGEALALFFVGILYPGFERAQYWREYGWRVLVEESARQVREDGFHFEQSVYYHVYALDMFIHARILAARNGIAIPEKYDQTLKLMAEGLATIGAGGKAPRFGDDDGGRLFDGRRNRSENMLDPLAAAAILYNRADWKAAGDLHEETIWLVGTEGLLLFDKLPPEANPLRSRAFPASGYYTMTSKTGLAIIDAGPHGWGNGGHGHADALSMQLIARGQTWLTDPGTGSYPYEKPERNLFRGTSAHNTLEVDGRSQADPLHAFAWGKHPVTHVRRWHEGKRIQLFHGSHDGYARLISPVTHERWVIGWPDDFWIVADRASGRDAHRTDVRWHLAPECAVAVGTLANSWIVKAGHESLEIIASGDKEWISACEAGSLSTSYGAVISAPVLHFSRHGSLPAELLTVLALNQPDRVSVRGVPADGANAYLCSVGNSHRLVALANRPGIWHCDKIATDAALFVVEFSPTAVVCVLASGASEGHIDGSAIGFENGNDETGEAIVGDSAGPSLNPAAAKSLLQVLERLSGSGRS